jgi:protein phosphatase methylesterase 1
MNPKRWKELYMYFILCKSFVTFREARRKCFGRKRDYTPVQWSRYFSERRDVAVNGNQFRVYCLGDSGPLLVLLHGGGFSALTWALFSVSY